MRAVHGILHSLQGSAFVTTFMPADGHAPTTNLKNGNGESQEERDRKVHVVRGLFGLHGHHETKPDSGEETEP